MLEYLRLIFLLSERIQDRSKWFEMIQNDIFFRKSNLAKFPEMSSIPKWCFSNRSHDRNWWVNDDVITWPKSGSNVAWMVGLDDVTWLSLGWTGSKRFKKFIFIENELFVMIQNDSENGLTKNQNLQDWSKSRNCRMFHSDNFHKGATMSKRQPWDWMGWEQSWKFLIKCHFGQLNNLSQF